MIYKHKNHQPQITDTCFIAPTAVVIGDAHLEANVNLWYGAVVRADVNRITIGEETNIQDNAVLHVTYANSLSIGKRCTVGHGAIVHACTVEDDCLIGMGSIILDGAVIGSQSLVGAGAVVPPNKHFPPRSLLLGSPAKMVRTLTDEDLAGMQKNVDEYLALAKEAEASIGE
ncbi:MAG: gamma carbonic anhydrase family protein [Sphaerochaeta sp.]